MNKLLIRESEYINGLPLTNIQKVKLYQMLYRGMTHDSSTYFLLHGSTAITKSGKCILFGDGVDCIGKTSTSLFVGLDSGRYVADEYSVYNDLTGTLYGNPSMLIFVRNKMKGILPIDIKWSNQPETSFLPSDIGLKVESAKLDMIVSPHLGNRLELVEETNPIRKMRKMAITSTAHRLKFTDNSLDRVNGTSHSDEKIEISDYTIGLNVPTSLLELPYYDAYLQESSQIIDLLKGL